MFSLFRCVGVGGEARETPRAALHLPLWASRSGVRSANFHIHVIVYQGTIKPELNSMDSTTALLLTRVAIQDVTQSPIGGERPNGLLRYCITFFKLIQWNSRNFRVFIE